MADYKNNPKKMVFDGMVLSSPIDYPLKKGQFAYTKNIRSYFEGTIQTRPGFSSKLTLPAGSSGPGVIWIKRLNDYTNATFTYLALSGDPSTPASGRLYTGPSSLLTLVTTGFSGKPLTSAIAAPFQSPLPFIYIGDSTKYGKMKAGDTSLTNWGIPAPNQAPDVTIGAPSTIIISDMNDDSVWTQGGTAAAPTDTDRVSTTITKIVYDSGSTGYASIQLASFVNVGRGMFLDVGSEVSVVVDQVIPKITSTTVGQIIYDSGSTGKAWVQFTIPGGSRKLVKGSLITLSSETVVVQDVSYSPDGTTVAARVSTSGTIAAGDSVTGLTAIRVYLASTHAAAEAVVTKMLEVDIGAGIGYITQVGTINAAASTSRPVVDEDEVHISLQVNKLNRLIEMKIFFDVDVSTNDFTKNYYFKAISPNDFVEVTENALTVLEARISRLQHKLMNAIQANDFARAEALRQRIRNKQAQLSEVSKTPLDDQTVLGDAQFTELRFKVKELTRVGGDLTRTLRDVAAVRIQVNCKKSLELTADAWWIGGGYGPDVGDTGDGYHYMYRYRAKATGAISNWSPMLRGGIEAHRQQIIVSPTASSDSQVDYYDVARIGGTVSVWKKIGSSPSGSSFVDIHDDLSVSLMSDAEIDYHQPWTIIDLPASGTVKVAGSNITALSGTFNVQWEKNTPIIIGNQVFTLAGPPFSTTRAAINENAGNIASTNWLVPAGTLAGQPMPCVFGPFGYGPNGVYIFAVGDTKNPGTLYFTVGNNPDVQHARGQLQVCGPSEKLMNGAIWEGRAFVFSEDNMFEIFPNFSNDLSFTSQQILGAKGLFGAYALCVAPEGIYHVCKDGIYLNGRDNVTGDLYPLFPHDGNIGITVNGVVPPDFSKPNELRLEYHDGYLYFDFRDTDSNYRTLVMRTYNRAWSIDIPNVLGLQTAMHYGNEGDSIHELLVGGKSAAGVYSVYSQTVGVSDAGSPILCEAKTWADDEGEARQNKLYGDVWVDFDSKNLNLSTSIGFNNFSTNPTPDPQTIVQNGRGNKIVNINSGAGQLAKNIALDLSWSATNGEQVILYGWDSTWIVKPIDTDQVYTDADDAGYFGAKFLQGFILEANTFGIAKSITVQGDNGTNGAWTDIATFTINHAQQSENGYSIPVVSFASSGNIAHHFRLKVNDSVLWEFFRVKWIFEPEPELVLVYKTQQTTHGNQGYQFAKEAYISLLSSGTVTYKVIIDGVTFTYSIPSTSSTRKKIYVLFNPAKGKSFEHEFSSSSPFRLYLKDCEWKSKSWGSDGGWNITNPFGAPHREAGALI